MVGRPRTRIKKLRELNADVERLLGRLITIAPQRASTEVPPQDPVGLLWYEAVDGMANMYLSIEGVIEQLDSRMNGAGARPSPEKEFPRVRA